MVAVVAPDAMSSIPFEVLGPDAEHALIRSHPVVHVNRLLAPGPRSWNQTGESVVIGADSDGLTEAEKEAGLVAAALGVPPHVGDIDPTTLPKIVSNARRIHIAAHNFFNARDLFASRLQLGAGGSIQAWELFRLIRSPELVMLSGCETLSEAVTFLDSFSTGTAGAKWVVGTRWTLHDRAAATAAAAFYSALGSNAPPRALWLAKNRLIKDGYAHPYYWAAFEMMAPNLASVF